MLQFEGDIDFPQAPEQVFAQLSDARFLVSCIPGVESVKKAEPVEAECILRPGFSFVRGTLAITMRILETTAPTAIKVTAHGKSIGASNDVESQLSLAAHEGGTRIHWNAAVTNLGGLLKAVPQGLLKGAAQKVIADVWESIGKKLASEPAS